MSDNWTSRCLRKHELCCIIYSMLSASDIICEVQKKNKKFAAKKGKLKEWLSN